MPHRHNAYHTRRYLNIVGTRTPKVDRIDVQSAVRSGKRLTQHLACSSHTQFVASGAEPKYVVVSTN